LFIHEEITGHALKAKEIDGKRSIIIVDISIASGNRLGR